ncbi:MAG: ATP-dependent zinc metalloprotease FtsH [Clostridia bacterium]|nr:ATP-dependent zinc metalloprotease FtsH [Clostridia bacterium]
MILPIVLVLTFAYFTASQNGNNVKYSDLVNLFKQNQVTEYTLNLSSGAIKYKVKGDNSELLYTVPSVEIFLNDIHNDVIEYNEKNPDSAIKYDYKAGSNSSVWASLLPMMLMSALLVFAMFFIYRKMGQTISMENNKTLSFGKARVKMGKDEKRKTTFDDVAGAEEEKAELAEIVDFLRDREKFNAIGARIPKGILLVGPPGTGKTLLARAVAGEAGVPFFSISGSDFVEMYVGVGASRVRDLFEQAKKNSPSILFIDEIDAVGRHRGAGMGGGHDEREQTLNQLLVEMDGFGANEGVIIIAATNRPDILDPALLRPGRFDRQITVGYPDVKGREDILKVHSKGKALAPDVNFRTIAQGTSGFTGADLENLLNEAALIAVRNKKKAITMEDVEEAKIKVIVGTEKKSHKMSDKEKKLTAYHEAGHAISRHFIPGQDKVHQVSIIPTGMAGGYTLYLPEEDKAYNLKSDMLDEIVILLGGRVAEALILGDISTGASNDIERATKLARNMVTRYGMSENIGPVSYTSENHEVFLGRDYGSAKNYSENIAFEIDKEIHSIVSNAYKRCEKILTDHTDKLHILADYLIKHEKIDAEGFEKLMNDCNDSDASSEDDENTTETTSEE